jgi:hypothetical protein
LQDVDLYLLDAQTFVEWQSNLCFVKFILLILNPNWPPPSAPMRTRFYATSSKLSKPTQAVKKKAKRPQLSKEARTAVNARRCLAAQNYRNELGEAWATIDKLIEDLAQNHHKSICHVQSKLHMGHQLASREHKKTNAWNAFCWKKSQDKENGKCATILIFRH